MCACPRVAPSPADQRIVVEPVEERRFSARVRIKIRAFAPERAAEGLVWP